MSSDAETPPRHALVTGSSSGIGKAVAQRLLADGWHVTGFDRSLPSIEHASFAAVAVDLLSTQALGRCMLALPDLQAFVHAAGVLRVADLGNLDHASSELMWRLHVDAAMRLADGIVPGMSARGDGRVVLIGSRVASGMAGRSQYAATKAALIAASRSWAVECADCGVTCNVVSPAATETPMTHDPGRANSAPRLPPIGRLILSSEVASMVTYLLSPAAAAITGQDIVICGGASLNR